MKVSVLGGGSWATAIVKLLTNNIDVSWWPRSKDAVSYLNEFHHNPKYLQSVEFDLNKLYLSNNIEKVISNGDLIIVAIPAAFIDEQLKDVDPELLQNKIIFSATKGMIPEYNLIPAEYFHSKYNVPYHQLGIICGPCHAEEVALERLSYLTIASSEKKHALTLSEYLSCRYLKTMISDDLIGAEYSCILKNVYALAAGICSGVGYGDNFISVLIANSIQELERFIDIAHPIHRDTKSSAYLGDLLVTAYSKFSRNRTFGFMIGKGYSVRSAQLEMNMIAEGYYAAKSLHHINKKYNVEMPILSFVFDVLYNKKSPKKEIVSLSIKMV